MVIGCCCDDLAVFVHDFHVLPPIQRAARPPRWCAIYLTLCGPWAFQPMKITASVFDMRHIAALCVPTGKVPTGKARLRRARASTRRSRTWKPPGDDKWANCLLWINSKVPRQSYAALKTREVPHGINLLDAPSRKMPSMWFWVGPSRVA
jgi:hypothetical protein